MGIDFKEEALRDKEYWKAYGTPAIREKIKSLLKSMKQTPFSGIGKPEPLKYDLAGKWSRRINRTNRIVYSVENGIITVYSLRGHYD